MSLLTLNGNPVISGEIRMPRVGIFDGDLFVDSQQPVPTNSVLTTDDGSFSLKCYLHPGRNETFIQSLCVHFVGGSGGLANSDMSSVLKPRAYTGYTVRRVLTDILTDAGETLSPNTDPSVLNRFLQRWSRLGGTPKQAVQTLMSFAGCEAWRILGDGTFWATMSEPWPQVATEDFEVISRSISENWCLIASERPFALPGQTIVLPSEAAGSANPTQRISGAIHTFEPGLVQCRLYFEDVQ
jgi:hypothetical protein